MSLNSSGLQQSRLAVQVGVSGSSSNFSDAEKTPVSATRNLKLETRNCSTKQLVSVITPACHWIVAAYSSQDWLCKWGVSG